MGSHIGTVISIIGETSGAIIRDLSALPSVTAITGADESEAAERIRASDATYVVHDSDPLAHVASAWVEFYDDRSTIGVLDLEVDSALASLSNGESRMPDYYVVLEPQHIEGTWKHWWLGVLASAAPTRVLPREADAATIRRTMRSLPAGRPWPEPRAWLRDVQFAVPDRIGLAG
jgi:hypothetical protein